MQPPGDEAGGKYVRLREGFPAKHYLEHILRAWSDATN
jgi:hypothetical protein